jgi:hypothetical protein
VFHGWPSEWVNSKPKFEEVGIIETGQGYRLHKLRYEIVPGFQSVAILYEPEKLQGKVPAILNLNGHVGPPGKAVEYKQKRCINFAKHGILALNLEWFFFGELRQQGNQHWYAAHLDLVGANGLGVFLLEMRRGLDYLYNHPSHDPMGLCPKLCPLRYCAPPSDTSVSDAQKGIHGLPAQSSRQRRFAPTAVHLHSGTLFAFHPERCSPSPEYPQHLSAHSW